MPDRRLRPRPRCRGNAQSLVERARRARSCTSERTWCRAAGRRARRCRRGCCGNRGRPRGTQIADHSRRPAQDLVLGLELPGLGGVEQRRVGKRSPREVREARGHLVGRRARDGGVRRWSSELDSIEKLRRLQRHLDHRGNPVRVGGAALASGVRAQERRALRFVERSAKGAAAEVVHELPRARIFPRGRRVARCDARESRRVFHRARRDALRNRVVRVHEDARGGERCGVVAEAVSLLLRWQQSPGLVVSPRRSRTVLLYSKRVNLRTGEAPGLGAVQLGSGFDVVLPPVVAPAPYLPVVTPAPVVAPEPVEPAPVPVARPPGSRGSIGASPILPWQPK